MKWAWVRAGENSVLAELQHPSPLSSRPGLPATQHWTKQRVRLSPKRRRMRPANATKLHRKSGGAKPRDLRFRGPFLEMFFDKPKRSAGTCASHEDSQ